MLSLDHITFTYPKTNEPVFRDFSVQVDRGRFVSIIGQSGSGKTTLFRLLNGLEQAESGHILIDGTLISELQNYASYMPQEDLLFPWLTVSQNVMLPMQLQKKPIAFCQEQAAAMLARAGLSEWASRWPKELSGGMRQRVSFARTLCAGGDLLLLDEPFSALDAITRVSLQEWLLEQWAALEKTILFITHDVEEAIFLSEEILVLTGHPVSRALSFSVPLPSKRDRQMLLQPQIAALREELIKLLREQNPDEGKAAI